MSIKVPTWQIEARERFNMWACATAHSIMAMLAAWLGFHELAQLFGLIAFIIILFRLIF